MQASRSPAHPADGILSEAVSRIIGQDELRAPENNFPSSTQPTRERSSIFFQFSTKYTIDPVPVAHILECARQGFPVRTVKATGCLSCFLIAIPIVQSLY